MVSKPLFSEYLRRPLPCFSPAIPNRRFEAIPSYWAQIRSFHASHGHCPGDTRKTAFGLVCNMSSNTIYSSHCLKYNRSAYINSACRREPPKNLCWSCPRMLITPPLSAFCKMEIDVPGRKPMSSDISKTLSSRGLAV